MCQMKTLSSQRLFENTASKSTTRSQLLVFTNQFSCLRRCSSARPSHQLPACCFFSLQRRIYGSSSRWKTSQDHFWRAVGCSSHVSFHEVQHGSVFNEPKRLGGFPPNRPTTSSTAECLVGCSGQLVIKRGALPSN